MHLYLYSHIVHGIRHKALKHSGFELLSSSCVGGQLGFLWLVVLGAKLGLRALNRRMVHYGFVQLKRAPHYIWYLPILQPRNLGSVATQPASAVTLRKPKACVLIYSNTYHPVRCPLSRTVSAVRSALSATLGMATTSLPTQERAVKHPVLHHFAHRSI
jgi:hypothetical protein